MRRREGYILEETFDESYEKNDALKRRRRKNFVGIKTTTLRHRPEIFKNLDDQNCRTALRHHHHQIIRTGAGKAMSRLTLA